MCAKRCLPSRQSSAAQRNRHPLLPQGTAIGTDDIELAERAFADWAAELFAQCPLLNGKGEAYDPGVCTFGGKAPESTTVRDIIEQRNVAESVL